MNTRRRALLLAYYFPPAIGVASERMDAFYRHLPALGWSPTVLTPRNPHFHRARGGGGSELPDVIRTPALELSRVVRKLQAGPSVDASQSPEGGRVAPVNTGAVGSLLRRWVREWVYLPDAQVGWIPPLLRAGGKVLREDAPGNRVIFSSSVPYSAHLAAARLAARFDVPWVAEFRDPWSAQDPVLLPRTSVRRAMDRRIEASLLGKADAVVVTAEATKALLLDTFPETAPGKVRVVTNGFDPLPLGTPPPPGEPMTLVHAGTLHDSAYVEPVLSALAELSSGAHPLVRLVVLGDETLWCKALDDLGLGRPDWMALRGVVSSQGARDAVQDASVLLLPAPHPRFRKILLGKLLTYLGARRPILGVVPEGSEMDQLLESSADGHMVRPWEAEGVKRVLAALLEEHRAGTLQAPRIDEDLVLGYTREAQAESLARVFDEVSMERGRS